MTKSSMSRMYRDDKTILWERPMNRRVVTYYRPVFNDFLYALEAWNERYRWWSRKPIRAWVEVTTTLSLDLAEKWIEHYKKGNSE